MINVKEDNIDIYFKMINNLASLSKCNKLKVGSLILKNNSIISTGVNGTPRGYKNSCEENIVTCLICGKTHTVKQSHGPYSYICGCTAELRFDEVSNNIKQVSSDVVVHSEENAILNAVRNHIPLEGSSILISHAPCIKCAKLIQGTGIREVIYKDDYKNSDGVDLLKELNIKVFKWGDCR